MLRYLIASTNTVKGGPRESAALQSNTPFVVNSELKEIPHLPRNKTSESITLGSLDDDNLIFDCEQSENRPPLQHSYTRGPEENHSKSKKRMDIRKMLMSPPKMLAQVPECDPLLDNEAEPASSDSNRESLSSLSLGRDILTALNDQTEVSSILQRKRDSLASKHLGKDILSTIRVQNGVSERLDRTKGASSKKDYAPVSTQNLLELEALDPWKPSTL